MVRPRTLSRSTKVVAEGHEHKRRKGNKKKNGPSKKAVKWDHDDTSSSDGEPKSTATKASAGKKRPRQDGAGVEVVSRGAVVKEKEVLERRPGADGEVDSEGGRDLVPAQGGSGEEDEGEADDLEVVRGNQTAAAASKGGMGDVMAKIMGQQLGSKTQVPLLAKRKTKAMKEMEEEGAKRAESRGKAVARRAQMTQQFVVPDHTATDYERQLKKIATRGVVALFNAISKRQNQGQGGDGVGSGGKSAAGAAKAASRNAFLNMLKTGVKPESATGAVGKGPGKRQGAGVGRSAPVGVDAEGDGKKRGVEEEGAQSWSVLREDYMMGATSMKNWDQESAESETDALGQVDAMSDDDSD